ncbi:MAG: hypothetical protein DIU79_04100 [Actinobacteria bacterium]|jgi:hypothetical protein|nr:MAG: hypothetical protein DIU79_04100 [Actinomycetota bacterium]
MSVDPGPTAGLVIARIAEIHVTPVAVRTPAGDLPLAGSMWHVTDSWRAEQTTPVWAVLAAVFGSCVAPGLSLLLLRVKRTVHRGVVEVAVAHGAWRYVARVPVRNPVEARRLHDEVGYVRALAAL